MYIPYIMLAIRIKCCFNFRKNFQRSNANVMNEISQGPEKFGISRNNRLLNSWQSYLKFVWNKILFICVEKSEVFEFHQNPKLYWAIQQNSCSDLFILYLIDVYDFVYFREWQRNSQMYVLEKLTSMKTVYALKLRFHLCVHALYMYTFFRCL